MTDKGEKMKKTIIFIMLIIFVLTFACYAEEDVNVSEEKQDVSTNVINTDNEDANGEAAEEFDIKAYLTEKIAPIIAGVVTSLVALGGTVYKIKSSLSTLDSSNESIKEIKKSAKDTLENVKTELTRGMCDIQTKIKDIPEIKEGYEELKRNTEELSKQNRALLEALKLGFESLPEAVISGNARKISIITDGVGDKK